MEAVHTYSAADFHTIFLLENLGPRSYKGVIYVYIYTDIIVISHGYVYRHYSDVIYVYVQLLQ
jgi:hypothetical protein